VALAESLGVHRLATSDVRHFAAVRLRDGQSLDLVVHPMDPTTTGDAQSSIAGRSYTGIAVSDRRTLRGLTQFTVCSLESRS
jgi:hypothetical protein